MKCEICKEVMSEEENKRLDDLKVCGFCYKNAVDSDSYDRSQEYYEE